MLARTIRLGTLLLSLALGACANDPSTMHRVPANGPMPQAVDGRTGVLGVMELIEGSTYETTLRRIENGAYTTLTPPIPDDHGGDIVTVRWLEGRALASDIEGRLFRFTPEAGWEVVSLAGCDPTLSSAMLLDARAMDDGWVLATDYAHSTLCHFDGAGFDSAESLSFVPAQLVEIDGALFATDTATNHVMTRAVGGTEWSRVPGIETSTGTITRLVARDDGAYVSFTSAEGDERWSRVTGTPGPIDGIPGMHGERWRVEEATQTHEHCSESWFDGHTYCSDVVDVIEEHVMRVDGPNPVEVGMLRIERPGTLWFETIVVGPGQLVLTSSSGDVFVTPTE